ncbi:cytidine/deoxycytidylate deaminase family protein [Nocardia otitidiscaviarum]|uniref:Cytidine deaminase n=1 Tax=Nocardia otitidiscaviarum TaxID=1823 RepID=A0A516NHI7_9NOCA|nr:cytidine deaminase [Nocardia otitidiscaviarum]MBF6177542.1 cytidine deaminase [Nocardia otitidiscaviarum]MCP9620128.1 cytidine deaminase [Nocardia otitidiscaviarum]QDP78374.1 cytidine deaminase [Nocardia otitidiscaviarum]
MIELDAEDNKLLILARGAMGRTGGSGGAAIRDTDGRTYAAGEVSLHALRLTALQAAVAAAISSGAEGFEAAVVVGSPFSDRGVAAVREVSETAKIIFSDAKGKVFDIVDGPVEGDPAQRSGVPESSDAQSGSEVFE